MSQAGISTLNVNPFGYEKELEKRGALSELKRKADYKS
jgi:hypothetical protein